MQNLRIAAWTFNPFLRILPAFIFGVLAGVTFSIPVWIPASSIALAITSLTVVKKFWPLYFATLGNLAGMVIVLIIVCAGALVQLLHDPKNVSTFIGRENTRGVLFKVRLTEEPVKTQSGYRAIAEVASMLNADREIRKSGKVYLYFSGVDSVPAYGDRLIINSEPKQLNASMNPGAFDFREYAARKGIHFAVYLKKGDFLKIAADPHWFVSFLNLSREKILAAFDRFFPEQDVRGIAAALLIGYRGDLEKPLLQEYSDAGVVHVIAISGLHLGLIYVVLVWIFSKIRFLSRFASIRCWAVLVLLWLFSLLTGGSASVLRSAVMFSCILIGETYFKKSGTWNVIAASAFLLLVYDPMLLYDAGFLLSYAAVGGIVAWQKPLYHAFYIRNKIIRQVWNMSSVTIAAQIAAFPLCIYYFHQFPNLFLFTNFIVVPLSTVILFGEVLLLIVAPVSYVNDVVAKLLSVLINFMNEFVRWSNTIPFSSTRGIYANLLSAILMYSTVLCLTIWLVNRKRSFAIPGFFFLSVLAVYFLFLDVNAHNRSMIVFYHSAKSSVIDLVHRRKAYSISFAKVDPGFGSSSITGPARTIFRADEDTFFISSFLKKYPGGFSFLGKEVVVFSGQPFSLSGEPITADYLLVTGNPAAELGPIISMVRPSLVVFDATNSPRKIAQWKRECELLHLRSFSIRDDGALVSTLHPD